MYGHLVVIGSSDIAQIIHHYKNTIFICVGCDIAQINGSGNECIVIEEQAPLTLVFNQLLEIFDIFLAWEAALEKSVNRSLSFDAIIRSCDVLLEDPLALVDSQFRYISYSKRLAYENGYEERYVENDNYLSLEAINHLTAMSDFNKLDEIHDVFQYTCNENFLHKNIFNNQIYVGRLSIPFTQDSIKNAYYKQILIIVAQYVETLYAKLGTFWHRRSQDTKFKQILRCLLCGNTVEQETLCSLLANRGYGSYDQYYLIQIKSHFTKNEIKLGNALTTQLEDLWPGTCCIDYQQRLIVLTNITKFESGTKKLFTQELAYFLRESLLLAGISRKFTNLFSIQAAFQQTDIALDIGARVNPMYWYFKFDDYAYLHLLRSGYQNFLPEQICELSINILREYDNKNNTELNLTLRTYIRLQYNAVSASRALCIARSTFLKRLARIQALTDIDFNNHHQRTYLALSYEIFEQFNVDTEGNKTELSENSQMA
ncbi:MAG: PucR family transcriptional regulator [Oscillospiraceae bacterium]